MDIFAESVGDFGRHLGINGLQPGASGSVDLSIEQIGRLQLEREGDVALITLARAWPRHAARAARAALDLCHWRENHPWAIQAGVKGEEWLLFTVRLPLTQLDVPTLDRILGYLSNLQDAVEKAG